MILAELTDEALAVRARVEPRAAFEILFERYRGPLYSFLLRHGVEPSRADDLFQTAFLKAYRAIGSFRQDSRFKTWLYTIAVNVLMDDRRAGRRRAVEKTLSEAEGVAGPPRRDPLERAEAGDRIREALDRVPVKHRHLFALVRFQGLSISESAGVVGMTPAAAKVTLFRVHKKVGEALAGVREKI